MSIEDEKKIDEIDPLEVNSRSLNVFNRLRMTSHDLKDKTRPLKFYEQPSCDILTARTWKKRLQRRRKTSNWTALQPGSNHWFHLVTAQICKVELNHFLTASPLFGPGGLYTRWLVYTKFWECKKLRPFVEISNQISIK